MSGLERKCRKGKTRWTSDSVRQPVRPRLRGRGEGHDVSHSCLPSSPPSQLISSPPSPCLLSYYMVCKVFRGSSSGLGGDLKRTSPARPLAPPLHALTPTLTPRSPPPPCWLRSVCQEVFHSSWLQTAGNLLPRVTRL